MQECTFRVPLSFVFASVIVVALTAVAASAQTQPCTNPSSPDTTLTPTNLRVDIADGTTGKLFVSWQPATAATSKTYYYVCRSSPDASNYQPVAYCSETLQNGKLVPPAYKNGTPGSTLVCRDDGGVLANYPNGSPLITSPPTNYYYEIQACNSASDCSSFYTGAGGVNYSFNTPVICNGCTLPFLQNLLPTNETGVPTTTVLGSLYPTPFPCPITMTLAQCTASTYNKNQYFGHNNSGATNGVYTVKNLNTLVVSLPGSGSFCGGGELSWVARNLGYDTICVNYDDTAEQENVCAQGNFTDSKPLHLSGKDLVDAVAGCFTNISYAKLNWTAPSGNCLAPYDPVKNPSGAYCGKDTNGNTKAGKVGSTYYVASSYDSVVNRITTMLEYLCNNDDGSGVTWEQYLAGGVCTPIGQSGVSPNWSKIIMGGWSQGGDMSTFGAFALGTPASHLDRAINLSAPPSAAPVVTTSYLMVPASYLAGFTNGTSAAPVSSIYGLVSANDFTHFCRYEQIVGPNLYSASVYESVWRAMKIDTEEVDLNVNASNQPCTAATAPPTKTIEYVAPTSPFPFNMQSSVNSGPPSHNFVNWAVVNQKQNGGAGDGHADPLYVWNEDIFEFMLLD